MFKKLLSAATIVGVLALPALALADSITVGVQTQCGTITSWSMDFSAAGSYSITKNGVAFVSGFSSSGLPSGSVSEPFAIGDDIEITHPGGLNGYSIGGTFGCAPAPIAGLFISYPTSTAPALTATIGSQLADPGTIAFLALAIGVPLAFVIFHYMLDLFPSIRSFRKKHGGD